ncbi:hypothetical protein WJX72_000122 [[Myrmecia] bisecta]|uniref:Uncharacterized protein n=1 Tax=[Myrmecia] bisecta TaxID=41462 RepID=A0AAW1P4J1_9CHLO
MDSPARRCGVEDLRPSSCESGEGGDSFLQSFAKEQNRVRASNAQEGSSSTVTAGEQGSCASDGPATSADLDRFLNCDEHDFLGLEGLDLPERGELGSLAEDEILLYGDRAGSLRQRYRLAQDCGKNSRLSQPGSNHDPASAGTFSSLDSLGLWSRQHAGSISIGFPYFQDPELVTPTQMQMPRRLSAPVAAELSTAQRTAYPEPLSSGLPQPEVLLTRRLSDPYGGRLRNPFQQQILTARNFLMKYYEREKQQRQQEQQGRDASQRDKQAAEGQPWQRPSLPARIKRDDTSPCSQRQGSAKVHGEPPQRAQTPTPYSSGLAASSTPRLPRVSSNSAIGTLDLAVSSQQQLFHSLIQRADQQALLKELAENSASEESRDSALELGPANEAGNGRRAGPAAVARPCNDCNACRGDAPAMSKRRPHRNALCLLYSCKLPATAGNPLQL